MTYESNPASTEPGPRRRTDTQDAIHQAVELLRQRHEVREVSAYTMLIQASVDLHLSVSATAARLIEDSRGIPAPRA